MRTIAAITVAVAVVVGGCHKKTSPENVRIETISDAFASAGLKPSGFQPVDAQRFSAQRCLAGSIDGVDTVVCEYGSPEALALGKRAGEAWAGNAPTAAVLGNGRALLACADRARVDPNGRLIHKITQAFTKAR